MTLTDTNIDDLAIRHEQDKTKVNSFIKNNAKKPVNFNNGTLDIMSDNLNQKQKSHIDPNRSKILDQYDKQQNIYTTNDDDEEFQKLMERHNEEKMKVNTFESAQTNGNINNKPVDESVQDDLNKTEDISYELANNDYSNDDQNNKNDNSDMYNEKYEDNLLTT